jgi:hypothetical protein
MKIHPRFFKVRQIEAELGLLVAQFVAKHAEELTAAEWLQVLNEVFSGQSNRVIASMIREERHGNQETPGDSAGDEEG